MKFWTITVDDDRGIVTTVFTDDQAAYDALKKNYSDTEAGDPDFDVTTIDGRADLIMWLLNRCGIGVYVDTHEIEVPA